MIKIKTLLYIFISIILNYYAFNSTILISAEITEEEEKQLKSYKNLTKWMLDNQDNFENTIKENAKATNTKWMIDEKDSNVSSSKAKEVVNQKFHIVESGDTIYSISKKYNIPTDDIIKLNSLDDKKSLKVGDKIYLLEQEKIDDKNLTQNNSTTESPIKKDSLNVDNSNTTNNIDNEKTLQETELPEYKYYKVKKGDTLYSIAKMHNMTKDALVKLNNIQEPYELSLDVILKVSSNYVKEKKLPTDTSTDVDSFIWPVVGRLLIPFGPQAGGVINEGINISSKLGTPIKAVQDGVVVYVGNTLENFGNIVLIQHKKGWVSAYAHTDNIKIKKGDSIKQGQIIADVSNTGGVLQPQLHFELRQNVKPMDPLIYLNSYR